MAKYAMFTVLVANSLANLTKLRPNFEYNSGRGRLQSISDLLYCKNGKPGGRATELLQGMLDNKWQDLETIFSTVILTGDLEIFQKELVSQHKELQTLGLFPSKKKTFVVDGEEIPMTQEDFIKEFEITWPEGCVDTDSEALMSGNRRLILLVVCYNAIMRKAGLMDRIKTEILRTHVSYPGTPEKSPLRQRKDHSAYLNEGSKVGKQDATKLQTRYFCFEKVEDGAVQSDMTKLFKNRGTQQEGWEIPAITRIIGWAKEVVYCGKTYTKAKNMAVNPAYAVVKAEWLDDKIKFKQGTKLQLVRTIRLRSEHSDGGAVDFLSDDAKKKANPDGYVSTHLGRNRVDEFKAMVLKTPSIPQAACDLLEAFKDPDWKAPGKTEGPAVSSLPSKTIVGIATNQSGPVEELMNIMAGVNTSKDLADAARDLTATLSNLVEPLYLKDSDGNPCVDPDTGETLAPVEQKQFDEVCTELKAARAEVAMLTDEVKRLKDVIKGLRKKRRA